MSYSKIKEVAPMPNLIDIQTASYDWFMREGLKEVFEDISPIKDYADNLVLEFIDYSISDAPKYDQQECKDRDVTYAAPLKVRVRLVNKETGEVKEQEVFMGDFPIMTEQGTFIYNGAERVIVTQLVRSPGPYYDYTLDKSGNKMFSTTIIPNRGAWLEYETDANEALSVRVDRTRKQPITAILRALAYKSVEEKMESERRKNPGMTDADLAKKIRRVGEYHTETAGILYEGSNAEIQAIFGHDERLEKSLSKDTTTNY
jgi:DNA-directed RNA polymerase subunit beta